MMTGVDGWLKCGAFESALASAVGVKVPLSITPWACARADVSWLGTLSLEQTKIAIVIERIMVVPFSKPYLDDIRAAVQISYEKHQSQLAHLR